MKIIRYPTIIIFTSHMLFGALIDDTQELTGPASLFDLSYQAVLQSPQLTAQLEHIDRTVSSELIYEAILKRGPLGPRFILQAPDAPTQSMQLISDGITAFAYSHDGNIFAATTASGQLHIWDARTGQHTQMFKTDKDTQSLAFSNDNNTIVTITSTGRPSSISLQTNQVNNSYTRLGRSLSAFLSPDAQLVALLEPDDVRIINLALNDSTSNLTDPHHILSQYKTTEQRRLPGIYPAMRYEYTVSMRFSPDSSKIAVTGQTSGGGIWDTYTRNLIRNLPPSSPWRSSVLNWQSPGLSFSGDGQLLALLPPQELEGVAEKNIALVPTYDASNIRRLNLPAGIAQVNALALNTDGSLLAAHFKLVDPRAKSFIAIMNTNAQEFVHFPFALYDYCNWLTFSPDNSQLAAVSRSSRNIALWDVDVPARIAALTQEELSLLMDARQAWNNDTSYPIEAGNPIFRSIAAKLPYVNIPQLFTLHRAVLEASSSPTAPANLLSDD